MIGSGQSGPRHAMASWSTATVEARERFSYWREVVCQTVLNVSTEHPANGFSASIAGRTFGNLRFASFESTSHGIVRSNRHIATAPEASYLVSLQIRGRSNITQGEESFRLEPSEIAIVDGQRPFRVGFPDSVSRILAVIPREMLSHRAPWMSDAPACRKLSLTGPFSDLARRHLVQLTKGNDELSTREAVLMTENLCNLLTLASAREVRPSSLGPELMMQSILAFCRAHLHNAELSPSLVASHLGISVRTLQLRFQQSGTSFRRWLLESRLEACSKALSDPLQNGYSISTIAYRWGFNDLSHFNKAFRARFGVPPSQWRLTSRASLP